VTSSLQSLYSYEKRTRLNEAIHLVGFIAFAWLAASKFASGSLGAVGLVVALALNLILGLWPIVLQRYNRLRLYRAITDACHSLRTLDELLSFYGIDVKPTNAT
jgi:predicted histidine transporter YuiF (NhaC family)